MIIYSFHAILPSRKQEEEARRTKKKRGPKPKYLGVPIPNVNTMGRKGWRMWSPMGPTEAAVPGKPGPSYAVLVARPFLAVPAPPFLRSSQPQEESPYGSAAAGRGSGTPGYFARLGDQDRYLPEAVGGGGPGQVTDMLFRDLKLSQVQVMSFRAYP